MKKKIWLAAKATRTCKQANKNFVPWKKEKLNLSWAASNLPGVSAIAASVQHEIRHLSEIIKHSSLNLYLI